MDGRPAKRSAYWLLVWVASPLVGCPLAWWLAYSPWTVPGFVGLAAVGVLPFAFAVALPTLRLPHYAFRAPACRP